jgi:hypothetical protein
LSELRVEPYFGSSLPPQIVWLLIGILHYQERKHWAHQTLTQYLTGDVQCYPATYMSHVWSIPSEGTLPIPGVPDWGYRFVGNDRYVVHRATGETIHVRATNPALIHTWDFRDFLRSGHQPGPAERRLLELFPHLDGIAVGLRFLYDCRLFRILAPPDLGINRFKLYDPLLEYTGAVEDFLAAWESRQNRLELAVAIGDWAVAPQIAQSQGRRRLADRAAALAARSQQAWLNIVRVAADSPMDLALYALADARAEDLGEHLQAALRDSSRDEIAMDIIADDPRWRTSVAKLFRRSLKSSDLALSRKPAAFYLARHGHPVQPLIRGLLRKPADLSGAIELSLRFAPQQLRPLLHRGLRSRVCPDRLTAAAVLALLDCAWSREELLGRLQETGSRRRTIEIRGALRESRAPALRLVADEWEAEHPALDSCDSFPYEDDSSCERALRNRMLELADQVDSVRAALANR